MSHSPHYFSLRAHTRRAHFPGQCRRLPLRPHSPNSSSLPRRLRSPLFSLSPSRPHASRHTCCVPFSRPSYPRRRTNSAEPDFSSVLAEPPPRHLLLPRALLSWPVSCPASAPGHQDTGAVLLTASPLNRVFCPTLQHAYPDHLGMYLIFSCNVELSDATRLITLQSSLLLHKRTHSSLTWNR